MTRARNIKPRIMSNDELAALPPLTRLLFIYMWMLADREGRLEDKPKRIGAQALPYDAGADVDTMLDDLQRSGFIRRYAAAGFACIQILTFSKHQNPHSRESESELPPYSGLDNTQAVAKHDLGSASASPSIEQAGLIPDSGSLIPDSLIPDTKAAAAAKRAERFERVYEAFPLKKGREAARKAFDKLDPDDDLVATMLAAIAVQRQSPGWVKDDGQFIPHPATWINGKRWQDVATAPSRMHSGFDESRNYRHEVPADGTLPI
jgi:hypothetical protein